MTKDRKYHHKVNSQPGHCSWLLVNYLLISHQNLHGRIAHFIPEDSRNGLLTRNLTNFWHFKDHKISQEMYSKVAESRYPDAQKIFRLSNSFKASHNNVVQCCHRQPHFHRYWYGAHWESTKNWTVTVSTQDINEMVCDSGARCSKMQSQKSEASTHLQMTTRIKFRTQDFFLW